MDQIRLLTRTFFARLFESDLMPEGLPQVQLVLWGALLAAMPTIGYPMVVRRAFDSDRLMLITLTMVSIGVVSLIVWDGVFPDRRDVRILGPLPIPTHRFVLARLASLGQVFVLFATPVCVPQSIIFGLMAAGAGDPLPRLYGVLAHFVTVACAATFVFCALIAAQCLLLVLFGRRAAQAASMSFQVLFAVGLVQMLVFLGEIGRALGQGVRSADGLSAVAMLPPMWFFGVYKLVTNTGTATTAAFGQFGLAVTVASAALALVLYALTYSHLSRRALDGPPPQGARVPRSAVARVLQHAPRKGFNSPMRTAIRQFAIRSLVRSRTHRMMFAVYAGVALALVTSSAISVAVRNHGAGLWTPGLTMLTLPLIVQFLLMVAVRVIMSIPTEPKARWVFRACEPIDRGEAVSAFRDTMVMLVAIPSAIFAMVQGLIFWTIPDAVSHAAFCLAVGLFFAELLLTRTAKLPFACTYFPGKSRVFALWPLYLMAFFFYTLVLGAIDFALLTRPGKLVIFITCTVVATGLLSWYRRRTLAEQPGLRFEEEDPDAIFQGFQLSEGLAAAPRTVEPI